MDPAEKVAAAFGDDVGGHPLAEPVTQRVPVETVPTERFPSDEDLAARWQGTDTEEGPRQPAPIPGDAFAAPGGYARKHVSAAEIDITRRNGEDMTFDSPTTALAPETGRWEFDANVTAAFDDMLERSIPNYEDMRRITQDAASWLFDRAAAGGVSYSPIVDLGASRGSGVARLVDALGVRARFKLYDVSEPMLEALHQRFGGYEPSGVVSIERHDLRDGFPRGVPPAAAVLSVLTLQFVPIEHRQRLLRETYENLMPGGGLILVEKVLGQGYESDKLLVDLYYGLKRENGYTQEAIDRKRLSLEGVLVPLTADWNEELLTAAGFDLVEVIWAWANFRGWLAVKR